MISGIVHVLKSGGRWVDAPPEYGPKKTLYNRYVRGAEKGVWIDLFHALAQAGGMPVEVLIEQLGGEGASLGSGGKGGEKSGHWPLARRPHDENPCVDRRDCRPIAFVLTGGNVADCEAGAELLARLPPCEILHGDKGYDSNAIRRQIESDGATPKYRPRPIENGRIAFRPSSIATATPSSACSAD